MRGRLANDEVSSEKIGVNAEIAVKSTGFREIVARCCCVGKHALLVVLVGG